MKQLSSIIMLLITIIACNSNDDDTMANNKPLEVKHIKATINENSKKGTVIAKLTDKNIENATYKIVSLNIENAVEINSQKGELIIKDENIFNYEIYEQITGEYEVSLNDLTKKASFTIDISDVDDVSISTIAGDGTFGNTNGQGKLAKFSSPEDVAITDTGIIYVADFNNNAIKKIEVNNNVSVLLDNILGGISSLDVDENGTVWALPVDGGIYKVSSSGSLTILSGYSPAIPFDGVLNGVDLGENGDVFVSDYHYYSDSASSIKKIDNTKKVTTIVAGNEASDNNVTDGDKDKATFKRLDHIVVAKDGTIYATDDSNIRKITTEGTVTTIVKGLGATEGIAINKKSGTIYFSDWKKHVIYKYDTTTNKYSVIAGIKGTSGFKDTSNNEGTLYFPKGIAIDKEGNLIIADSGNHAIRKITL